MYDEKVVVLGFYNRQNIGDDAYTVAFRTIFKDVKDLTFVSMDDITEIPEGTDIVVCGGGDIINDYFMTKAQKFLNRFVGRVYAVSVGIPFASCAKYFHLFDHVFVRSMTDYDIATKEIGEQNVTYCPDAAMCIPYKKDHLITNPNKLRMAICLAQPLFYNNPKKSSLVKSLSSCLIRLSNFLKNTHNIDIEYHMLSFNFNENNTTECDKMINKSISKRLTEDGISVIYPEELENPESMLKYFASNIDISLCMRYHSVVFSLMTNTPFLAVFCSQKIANILRDAEYDPELTYSIPVDKQYRPSKIDEEELYNKLERLCTQKDINYTFDTAALSTIPAHVLANKKTSNLLVTHQIRSFDDVMASCRRNIPKYLHIDVSQYDTLLHTRQTFPLMESGKTYLELARFICFIISGQLHHPCLWGLAENMEKEDFLLLEAIDFIWKYSNDPNIDNEQLQVYYPKPKSFTRKVLFNLDYVFQNDFSQYHRSGWGYVVGALASMDAPRLLRDSDVFLDTYVDRSFHWGYDILTTIGLLPYKKPWYGFIHHTFDTTHSEYNCKELFNNTSFIESLSCCKGLLSLSSYLAEQLRDALKQQSLQTPVYVLYHPMEFVSVNFTMEKFLANPNKAIVQIGAWLRNPYAIYELPLSNNPLQLKKKALKGKEMEMYFAPPKFMDTLEETLLQRDWYHNSTSDMCRPFICRPHERCNKQKNSVNKYCQGLFDMIVQQNNSVEVIEKLSNDEYDKLLSENIVFLYLVDCSAVNTVIECIVRNTILIINRHPALEEILGVDYPGFYNNLLEASFICQDITRLTNIYTYMIRLDKQRYHLDFFINHLQNVVLSNGEEWNYSFDLFSKPSIASNVFKVKYGDLLKYLPRRFSNM